MDSEDDIYDSNEVDSIEEDYYSGEETDMDSDDEDGGYGDDEQGYMDDSIDSIDTTSRCQQNYTVLSEDDIRQRQEEAIMRISHELFISKVSATVLLRHYDWSVGKLHDDWFTDEEKVRATVGLLERPVVHYPSDKELTCRICFEKYHHNVMYSVACGHLFCGSCWKSYISISVKDGPGCLALRCPDPSCRAAVDQDIVDILVSEEDKQKYSRYLLRSYVEASKKTKWCPAPGCDYAIDFVVGSGSYDVSCNCKYGFCWNCAEEAHRPVNCGTVAKWVLKNSAESENTNWILVNSKPCPKCKRYIEKNQGCMHMTCTAPCKFEFCWLCLGSWKEHGKKTGGYYACNIYETAKQQGTFDETEKIREMAKSALERYTHYYERWAANESSRKKAFADFQQMQAVHMEKLIKIQSESEFQLKFITDAWLQIIECRRLLKWTYAYGYYLPEHEQAKKQLFEYLQGEAESWLERLHKCTEQDLQVYLNAEKPSEDFKDFRAKLTDMTIVTRNFFDNLGRGLENDLDGACSNTGSGIPLSTDETGRRRSDEGCS